MPCQLVASAGWPPIRLDSALVVVGRHPDCDARLDSPRVSRWHCCLSEVDGEVWVRDLGSTNGTWIDGRRVRSGRLRAGDVLAIAHLRYRMEEIRVELASWADHLGTPDDGLLSLADPPGTGLFDESWLPTDRGGPKRGRSY
jgi:predicted component of type VI protein secretion system